MRIAYLLHWSGGRGTGVFKKVVEQARTWLSEGHDVHLFVLCRRGTERDWIDLARSGTLVVTTTTFPNAPGAFGPMLRLGRSLVAWQPDIVYERDHQYFPGLATLLRALPRVIEINAVLESEAAVVNGLGVYLSYVRGTHRLGLHGASGFVFVTRELQKRYESFHRPSAVIANGIDLASFRVAPPVSNPSPRLVFIGTPNQPWHGVDKILRLAARFRSWRFDLIGVGPELVSAARPPSNVICHGVLPGEDYERIMSAADVAIGSLAMHRNGLEEACPLKTREYLARGLPVIIGYLDTDFPETRPFILRLPNTEDNVEVSTDLIEHFVLSWKGRRVPHDDVRQIDLQAKERKRLSFFAEVIRQSGLRRN